MKLLLVLLLAAVGCRRQQFTIHKSTSSQRLGRLFVDVNTQQHFGSVRIQPQVMELITKQQKDVLLTFRSNGSVFKSTVPHYIKGSQRIIVVLSSQFEIVGINYERVGKKEGQIDAEIFYSGERVDEGFRYTKIDKSQAQEEQGFFQKYKYALIIGAVLMMFVGGNKEPAAAQAPATN